jgi:hypothetical protein
MVTSDMVSRREIRRPASLPVTTSVSLRSLFACWTRVRAPLSAAAMDASFATAVIRVAPVGGLLLFHSCALPWLHVDKRDCCRAELCSYLSMEVVVLDNCHVPPPGHDHADWVAGSRDSSVPVPISGDEPSKLSNRRKGVRELLPTIVDSSRKVHWPERIHPCHRRRGSLKQGVHLVEPQ